MAREAQFRKSSVTIDETLHRGKLEVRFIRNSFNCCEFSATRFCRPSDGGRLHVHRLRGERLAQFALLCRTGDCLEADQHAFSAVYDCLAGIIRTDHGARPDDISNS